MKILTALCLATLACTAAAAEQTKGLLRIPEFAALADKASESVNVTLDSQLLGMGCRFLSSEDPEQADVKKLCTSLSGIYVRSYTFDSDFAYPKADVEMVRKQLSAPGWQQLMEVRSTKEQQRVDIYILVEQDRANGLAIIASQPREFTIVNIVGSVDMRKLHELEGQFGIPKLELEEKKQ